MATASSRWLGCLPLFAQGMSSTFGSALVHGSRLVHDSGRCLDVELCCSHAQSPGVYVGSTPLSYILNKSSPYLLPRIQLNVGVCIWARMALRVVNLIWIHLPVKVQKVHYLEFRHFPILNIFHSAYFRRCQVVLVPGLPGKGIVRFAF